MSDPAKTYASSQYTGTYAKRHMSIGDMFAHMSSDICQWILNHYSQVTGGKDTLVPRVRSVYVFYNFKETEFDMNECDE